MMMLVVLTVVNDSDSDSGNGAYNSPRDGTSHNDYGSIFGNKTGHCKCHKILTINITQLIG